MQRGANRFTKSSIHVDVTTKVSNQFQLQPDPKIYLLKPLATSRSNTSNKKTTAYTIFTSIIPTMDKPFNLAIPQPEMQVRGMQAAKVRDICDCATRQGISMRAPIHFRVGCTQSAHAQLTTDRLYTRKPISSDWQAREDTRLAPRSSLEVTSPVSKKPSSQATQ